MSNTYTTNNNTAGISGIKSYVLKLKAPGGSTKSKTMAATDWKNYSFSASPNTSYTLSVTAVDIAGNSESSSKTISTPPAKVSGLSFSNITYTSAKLSWNAAGGATSYKVNKRYNGTTTTVGSNIRTTSFTIPGLKPEEPYDLYVIAQNSAGSSDVSDKASVTTTKLPIITGSSLLCSGNYAYSIGNLLPGYSITWSSVHTRVSAQGSNPCTFKAGQILGNSTINATITDSYSTSADLKPKRVWVGKPEIFTYDENGNESLSGQVLRVPAGTVVTFEAYSYDINTSISWDVTPASAYYVDNGNTCTIMASASGFIGAMAIATNQCGEDYLLNTLTGTSGGGFPLSMEIYPNPAYETINISVVEPVSENSFSSMAANTNEPAQVEPYEVQIWSERNGLVKKQKIKSKKAQIDVSRLKPGIYYVHLIYKNKVVKEQLIIK
ncbi:fibronectin type III domain-containing protein [Carboxylicivirga sp. N1Y90]|uniref:fibronectin type III domain-containing protein n=1 Tax=Carboxylicivirga fragile TaxID=3417571 RepID=UPI003D32CC09|nr:fibronectin type III domain-containing protein [Marinilabiliaceae bacterium N1Y90]